MSNYTISSIPYYLLMAYPNGRGEDGDQVYSRVYKTLCTAYGVPENWIDDQDDRQSKKLPHNYRFVHYRLAFERALMASEGDGGVRGPDEPVTNAIDAAISDLYGATRAQLIKLDIAFFGGVYDINATKQVTDEELVALGAPTRDEVNAHWADCF